MSKLQEDLPWEETSNSLRARMTPPRKVRREIYARAMMVAETKIKDIRDLGAVFFGEKVFFEPYVDVLFRQQKLH